MEYYDGKKNDMFFQFAAYDIYFFPLRCSIDFCEGE